MSCVAEFFDGAFYVVHGDHISLFDAVLDVAAGGDVAGEEDESLADGECGGDADGGEDNYGER